MFVLKLENSFSILSYPPIIKKFNFDMIYFNEHIKTWNYKTNRNNM